MEIYTDRQKGDLHQESLTLRVKDHSDMLFETWLKQDGKPPECAHTRGRFGYSTPRKQQSTEEASTPNIGRGAETQSKTTMHSLTTTVRTLPSRLQTTQPTSGGAVTVVSSCCANCVVPPRPQQWGHDLPFFGHADPLDGWCCCSQKRVMSRPIQVRQL